MIWTIAMRIFPNVGDKRCHKVSMKMLDVNWRNRVSVHLYASTMLRIRMLW